MLQSGSGLPPGSPLQGQGVRQADSQTLCLPQTKVWETLLPTGSFFKKDPLSISLTQHTRFRWSRRKRTCPKVSGKLGLTAVFTSGVGLLPYRSQKSPQPPRYGTKAGSRGLSVGRGQGCNNAMTPGCSLLFGCKTAILKNAAGTLCNVATFKPPCSSTSVFRSCGSGCPEFSSSLYSQCVRRSHVPGLS